MMGGEVVPVRQPLYFDSLPVAVPIVAAIPGEGVFDPDQAIPLTWPLTGVGFVTGEHVAEGGDQHPGMDIAVPTGTPIRAAASGVVAEAGVDSMYGRYILIDHADSYQTMYGHASRTLVGAGDSVVTGEVIGLTGSTGRSTAPHLHFEIRLNGRTVDPRQLIEEVP
jgi:murein DD-endopeptidase MepM/ murein hydrolase activator NlpD